MTSFPYTGTGNVLKIQSLLHTCSEFYKAKDKDSAEQAQEEGAGSTEATPTSAKPGEAATTTSSSGGGGEDSSKTTEKPPEAATDAKKATSSKDTEMKDAEQVEPGAIGEPGSHQAVCVLGIALIAMGEDIGAEMALRTFNHLVSTCTCTCTCRYRWSLSKLIHVHVGTGGHYQIHVHAHVYADVYMYMYVACTVV